MDYGRHPSCGWLLLASSPSIEGYAPPCLSHCFPLLLLSPLIKQTLHRSSGMGSLPWGCERTRIQPAAGPTAPLTDGFVPSSIALEEDPEGGGTHTHPVAHPFHERQNGDQCAIHAFNNLIQRPLLDLATLSAYRAAPPPLPVPHQPQDPWLAEDLIHHNSGNFSFTLPTPGFPTTLPTTSQELTTLLLAPTPTSPYSHPTLFEPGCPPS